MDLGLPDGGLHVVVDAGRGQEAVRASSTALAKSGNHGISTPESSPGGLFSLTVLPSLVSRQPTHPPGAGPVKALRGAEADGRTAASSGARQPCRSVR